MKKILLTFFLFCFCLISPLRATPLTSTPLTLEVNHLTYLPKYTPKSYDDMLYISADDLALMTYGTLTPIEDHYKLVIQNQKIIFTTNSRYVEVNGTIHIISHTPVQTQDTIYIPLALLTVTQVPYTLSSEDLTLNIVPMLPYSTATDTYQSHQMLTTTYRTLSEIFNSLSESTDTSSLLKIALQSEQYLSIANITYKKEALALMQKLLLNDKSIQVHFRNLDLSTGFPSISDFTVLPLTYKFNSDSLSLQLGDTPLTANCFWATYNPSTYATAIDLNKSLDVMLMRSIYEYYRTLYPLKDDLHVLPVTIIQRGRSDAIHYPVYLEHLTEEIPYQVVVYKQCNAHTIDYYVDLKIVS